MTLLIKVMPLPIPLLWRAGVQQLRSAFGLVLAPGDVGLIYAEEVEVAIGQLEGLLGRATGLDSDVALLVGGLSGGDLRSIGGLKPTVVGHEETGRDQCEACDRYRYAQSRRPRMTPRPAPG